MPFSPDEDVNDQYRYLCLAVGHLFISFGRLEGVLSSILRLHLANNIADLDKANSLVLSSAIYGSMRFKSARDTVRRLAKSEGVSPEMDTYLDSIFSHVGHIENLRDKLAHQAVVPVHPDHLTQDGDWQVSDQTVTRDIKNPKVYVFSSDLVTDAANDLIAAADHLGVRVEKKLFENIKIEPLSWLYKPEKLKHVPLGKLRAQLKPRHQPRSSEG